VFFLFSSGSKNDLTSVIWGSMDIHFIFGWFWLWQFWALDVWWLASCQEGRFVDFGRCNFIDRGLQGFEG
jgi:hypothetical protein